MGETAELAGFVSATDFDDLPDETVAKAKEAVRDYVGVALYGSQCEIGEITARYVDRFEPGSHCAVIGHGSASATGAALANGTFGHAEDYDDSLTKFPDHPTSPVFPAAFAATQLEGGTGRDLLLGYVLGVEAMYRIEDSLRPGHPDKGWHATGTIATFGAATAAGSVFGFTTDQHRNAYGISGSCSSALFKNVGTMTKPYHAGHAAQMGLRAALLTRDGFTADPDVLEGDQGYGRVMTTEAAGYDPDLITGGLGERWALTGLGFKPYPSGRVTHAPMEALRRLVVREDLRPDDVARITVTITEYSDRVIHHTDPENSHQAKFSIEFCLAAVLLEREVGIHEFTDDFVTRPETVEQMEKVEREIVPDLFGEPIGYGGRITVELVDGRSFSEEEPVPLGNPENPMSEDQHERKFFECAETVLRREQAEEVLDVIAELERSDSPVRLAEAVSAG